MVLSCPDRPVHHCHQRNMSCWSCPVLIVLSITVITETCPAGLVLSWSSCPSLSSKKRFLLVLSCPDHPIHHYHQRNMSCWSCPACPVLIVLSITIIKETCPAGVILLVLSWSSKRGVLLSCPIWNRNMSFTPIYNISVGYLTRCLPLYHTFQMSALSLYTPIFYVSFCGLWIYKMSTILVLGLMTS